MPDMSLLKDLGDVAGIPGIALGVALFLFRDIIANALKLKPDHGFRVLKGCIVAALIIGCFGIAASLYGPIAPTETNTTYGNGGAIIKNTKGNVTYKIENAPAPNNSEPPTTTPPNKALAPSNATTTHGANSPIVSDTKGNVSIQIGPSKEKTK
jgi:hypothetical protein